MVRSAQRLTSRHFRRGPDGWGWSGKTTTAAAFAADALTTPKSLADHTKAELVELAEGRGLDSSGNKADIIARLEQP
jgi:hypothetical protein